MPSSWTREADRDSSSCTHDRDGHALHHPRRRDHLLGSFAERLLECGARVRDVNGELLPGVSDGLVARIAPPPLSEYANRWYSPPGVWKLGLNFQPSTLVHHIFVAAGSELASSVWVIQP